MRAGKLKRTSRPPPSAAPALRKVRRDRVCTAVEINSPNGFPQQDPPDRGMLDRRYILQEERTISSGRARAGRRSRGSGQRRTGDVEAAARVVDVRDELTDRARKRVRPAVLAERIGEPEHRALGVVDHVLVD